MPEVQSKLRADPSDGPKMVEFSALEVDLIVSYRLRGFRYGRAPRPPWRNLQASELKNVFSCGARLGARFLRCESSLPERFFGGSG